MARRSATVWEEVEDVLSKGEKPVINLSPATEVRPPKRPLGRPRTRVDGKEAGHWTNCTPAGWRMVCRARGCATRLKRGQVLVCSPRCEKSLRDHCELLLGILNGEIAPTELPGYMRSDRLRRGMKISM